MGRKRCRSCRCEYLDPQADGLLYFHVCPPDVSLRALLEDGTTITQPLAAFAGFELVATVADKRKRIDEGADAATIAIVLARIETPRANHRDENTLRREGEKGETRVLKHEGDGAIDLP